MNKADKYLYETLIKIEQNGTKDVDPRPRYKDGEPAHSVFVTHEVQQYDISKNEFPLLSIRPTAWKNAIKEILWIYQDQTSDLKVLEEKYGIKWWRDWESQDNPDTIGVRYGETVARHDLMNKLLHGLKNDPYGRRHIMNLWQNQDFLKSDGLLPCAFQTLWTVRGEYLDMALIQRSSDYLVAGHINQLQYVALMMMVAKTVGLKVGVFTHFINNCHIYDRHLDLAPVIKERYESLGDRNTNPTLKLNTDETNFYNFTIEDFEVLDYEPIKPQLKFELGI